MIRAYLGAALVAVWAVLVAWRYLRRQAPHVVRQMTWSGPISREDVDDFYGGVVPPGRYLYPAEPEWDSYQAAILR